jgi:Alpha-1,4-glucan:maltose-1-phosphate maltosyltransferase, domain N/S
LENGRKRIVIEALISEIDCGHFPIKRTEGEEVTVEADILAEGHDAIAARKPGSAHDMLSQARFPRQGSRNYVELRPDIVPAHEFVLRRRLRTERQFDYYM